ncbi:MAG: HAMP domain-containing histidine kinase [Lachnospiraceae bacterium]|nr:HAMP domain-containing histidine kinase [Lachnospiraceae bacterium]
MIKKMRQRVILASMAAFFAVIALIATLVNVVYFGVETGNADRTLSAILENEERRIDIPMPGNPEELPPMQPFMGLPNIEMNYMTRFFVVRADNEGNISPVGMDYIASVDSFDAIEYGSRVMKKNSDRGYIDEFRYLKSKKGDSTTIIFLNAAKEQQSMKSVLLLTIIVSAVSLAVVFVLVELFAGRAIRPIANNIKMQKQFITDASHELKTPLTSISTSLDVIEMEHGNDEWTENVRNQTGRMTKLVSELVTLSRLDEDMPLPDKEDFSLSNLGWEIVEIYENQAKAKNKKFSVDIEEEINIFGDKAAVGQMLSVLLDNANRYSDENGEIRFSIYKKKNKARIEVFNTCHYDTPPDTNRLFDRFYRPDESRSRETGGTGVGLSIAKAVAVAHGGEISASCPSGETMTIKITI